LGVSNAAEKGEPQLQNKRGDLINKIKIKIFGGFQNYEKNYIFGSRSDVNIWHEHSGNGKSGSEP